MSKRDLTGYINISPRKKCKDGRTEMFNLVIQESQSSSCQVTGFGTELHEQLQQYAISKSPVKVTLFKNNNYKKEVVNERSKVSAASVIDVPFDFDESICSLENKVASDTVKIADLEKMSDSCDKYFSLSGKILIGNELPKITSRGRVKDDIRLYDESGSIPLSLWNENIDLVQNKDQVTMTYLRLKSFNQKKCMSTSYSTVIKKIKGMKSVKVPEAYLEETAVIFIPQFTSIQKEEQVNLCSSCGTKVAENDIGKKSYHCKSCKSSFRLCSMNRISRYNLKMLHGGIPISLRADERILLPLLPVGTASTDITDELFDLDNMNIVYNKQSMSVVSINIQSSS